jgi:hypothetical protein
MRRVLFGIVWFFVFLFGGLMIGGAVVGGMAGHQSVTASANPPTTLSGGYNTGYEAGHSAGQEFGRKYGSLFLVGSLLLAVVGSAFGILPGTQQRTK